MVGDRIKDALDASGLEVRDLATTLETTVQSVYRWIRGEVEPSLKTLREIGRATDKPLYFFLSARAYTPRRAGRLLVLVDGIEVLRLPVLASSDIDIRMEREDSEA